MRVKWTRGILVRGLSALALTVGLAHCAASNDESAADSPGAGASGGAAPCVGAGCGTGGAATGGSGGTAGLPPEQELESSFRSPVATGKFVWTANPDSGRIALVDATSLEVHTVEAGFGPTYLAAIPDPNDPNASQAIVINVKSEDATVLRASTNGDVTTETVELHPGANSWALSKGGHWAIAWTDAKNVPNADPTQGFQDITVVDLSGTATATRLSVGYRPTRIFLSDDESRAFAITEPGVSVIELDSSLGPMVAKDVPVTDDPLENPASRDVSITPDGSYALVRRDGSPDVGIVSLADGTRVTVTLSGPVTDLDLSEDGSRMVAVVRTPGSPEPADAGTPDAGTPDAAPAATDAGADGSIEAGEGGPAEGGSTEGGTADAAPPPPAKSSEVFVLPIPGILTAPSQYDTVSIDGETVGSASVAPNGKVAVLYTNAIANDHLTLLDIATGTSYLEYRTVALKAAVKAAFVAEDGTHAVALLSPGSGSTKAGAFSLVPIANVLPPKIQGTDAPPMSVAIAPAPSTRAVVTTRDDAKKIYGAYLARMPQLQVDRIELPSPPLATGMVPVANVAFVAQEHPEGRITFIDLNDGKARTLTGFELGAKVVDGN